MFQGYGIHPTLKIPLMSVRWLPLRRSMSFTPCAEMKQAMRHAEIVSGGPNPNKQLSDEVIERRLVKYFEEHEFMQRRNFESVCECSRYTATKKLKELVKAGKLRAMGAKNVRFYVKGSL